MKRLCLILILTVVLITSCGGDIPVAEVVDEINNEDVLDFVPFIPFIREEQEPDTTLKPELEEVIINETPKKELEEMKVTIDYAYNIDPTEYENKLPVRYGQGKERILIFINEGCFFRFIKVCSVDYSSDDNLFYVDDNIFAISHLSSDYYIEYFVDISKDIPNKGVIFTAHDTNSFKDCSYLLSSNNQDDSICAIEEEIVDNQKDKYMWGSYYEMFDKLETIDGTELVYEENEDFYLDGMYIEYIHSNEKIFVGSNFYMPFINSPDKTKLAYGGWTGQTDGAKVPISIFDIITRETITTGDFGLEGRSTPKRIMWLDNEILLIIVGFSEGTVTRGGDIYYYNITNGSNGKVIEAKKNEGSLTEFTNMELKGDNIKFNVCEIYGGANSWLYYYNNISIEQIYNLIKNNETYIYEGIPIENFYTQ